MKTIGILGGLTWQSTVTYYREINRLIQEQLGGENSAKILLSSVNFAEIDVAQRVGDRFKQIELLLDGAKALERGGADFWLMACNTTHQWAEILTQEIQLPFLHIAKVAAAAIKKDGLRSVALTGTRYTMEQAFYRRDLEEEGLKVWIPNEEEKTELVRIVDEELTHGIREEASLQKFWMMAERWQQQGAQGVVLGCTEIGLLVQESHNGMPIFDTALLHASKAVELALGTEDMFKEWNYRQRSEL